MDYQGAKQKACAISNCASCLLFFLLPKIIKICSQYISLKLGLGKIFNLYENFQSKKLSMHISIVLRGTSVHEKRWVSTFFINTTLYVVQHLTVISAKQASQ